MEFVSIEELVPDILQETPGCSEFTIIDRIRWAAIEFCKQAGVSVETTNEMDLEEGESIITIPNPGASHVRPWQVLWAKTIAGPINPKTRHGLNENGINWEGRTGEWPHSYVRLSSTEIQLIPTPEESKLEAMGMHCSYIPARAATRLDAVLVDEYREAIVCGALSRLLNNSKAQWYDPREAQIREIAFRQEISAARPLANKDFMTGDLSVRMSPMA